MFSWGGNPASGSLHRFRDAVEQGWPDPLEIEEHSHADMAKRYAAGAAACRSGCCADTSAPTCRSARDRDQADRVPVYRRELAAVPAIRPDVGVDPRAEGGPRGKRAALGHHGVQKEAVLAGEARVVTVEEIVDALEPPPGRGRAAALGRHGRLRGKGRRLPVLRARLLRARQRLLQAWDESPRPRELHAARWRERGRRDRRAQPTR